MEATLPSRWNDFCRHRALRFGASDRQAAGPTPSIELTFRVDEPIAGVKCGQILTIHEWAGAWSMHRPMTRGQRILIFLYPPSRLGLTSPVGGSLGQIALDSSGQTVSAEASVRGATITVSQLERAIRAARNKNENATEKE